MKSKNWIGVLLVACAILAPAFAHAQSIGDDMQSMHAVLSDVYKDMTKDLSRLINVARGLAGFGAIFFIGFRVWKSLAAAEPVDVFPLLKPFCLAWCIAFYPVVIGVINGLMAPIDDATHQMVLDSDAAIKQLLTDKEAAIKNSTMWKMFVGEGGSGDLDTWYRYTHNNEAPPSALKSPLSAIGAGIQFQIEKQAYKFQNHVKNWLSEILNVLYQAASLCVDTIRTYYLVVLTLLGPLVFGFSCFDGLGHSMMNWLGRYLHVSLWLSVGNIFGSIIGKVQQNMIKIDIEQIKQYGDTVFGPSDTAYLVFLIIAIVGYTTVPSVANYIVQATGSHATLQRMTSLLAYTSKSGGQGMQAVARAGVHFNEGQKGSSSSGAEGGGSGISGAIGRIAGRAGAQANDYANRKLSGDS